MSERVPDDLRGPFVGRVHREHVDGRLVAVKIEPFAGDDQIELAGGDEFVTLWSRSELAPLEVWDR